MPIITAAACRTLLGAEQLPDIGVTDADLIAAHSPKLEAVAPTWAANNWPAACTCSKCHFVPQPGHSCGFRQRLVWVEAAVEAAARL